MSRFFPHTPYAEDQPLARTILITHVLHRGFETGALVGVAAFAPAWYSYSRWQASRARPPVVVPRPDFRLIVLRAAAGGALVGTAFLGFALAGRMRGRAEIEWKDRSWRLLENEGQLMVDDWSLTGAAAGAASALGAATQGARTVGRQAVLGRAAVGSLVGLVGYLGWRYAVSPLFTEKAKEVEKVDLEGITETTL